MNIYEKHAAIVRELKAPKSMRNTFAKFDYRNVSGIIEGVKPLLEKYKASLHLGDDIRQVGDRYYVDAVAVLVDIEKPEDAITAHSLAREQATKKGMDEAQVTGACSSYARKYALCGLFCIDDSEQDATPDIDGQDNRGTEAAHQDGVAAKGGAAKTAAPSKPRGTPKAQEAWKAFKALGNVAAMSPDARNQMWAELLKEQTGKTQGAQLTDADWDKVINQISIMEAM